MSRIIPRGLTRREAADLFGISLSTFQKARNEGRIPPPTLPGGRYDLALLQIAADRMSGIDSAAKNDSPLKGWQRKRNHARAP